ncbi:MAG: hypothetical protein RIQ88_180 [Actinomycetota bacterium]|jgi:hypothetical protein
MRIRRIILVIGILLITVGSTLVMTAKANAAGDSITKTFSGFAFEKPDLNLLMKSQIKTWIKSNPDYSVASCVGFTGQNVKKRSAAFLQKLATDRAKNICNYIRNVSGAISVYSTQGIPGNGTTAAARKVKVTLYKSSNAGGNGNIAVGVCDNSLTATMQSRIQQGEFYFSQISIKNISTSCKGNIFDVYFIDADGNQIASSLNNSILKTILNLSYSSFTPRDIRSDRIARVAFEIRKN